MRSRSRPASLVVGQRVNEGLVVGFVSTRRDSERLLVRLPAELRGPDVGNPDLNRSKPLLAKSLAMRADTNGGG
jgi:hypothetical protein